MHERRWDGGIAHGPARDGRRGGYVAIEQRRLNRERFGIVLEPERLFIRRQHGLRVDIDGHQIPHGVGVFGPIETMQAGGPARVHVRSSRAINCGARLELCSRPG